MVPGEDAGPAIAAAVAGLLVGADAGRLLLFLLHGAALGQGVLLLVELLLTPEVVLAPTVHLLDSVRFSMAQVLLKLKSAVLF